MEYFIFPPLIQFRTKKEILMTIIVAFEDRHYLEGIETDTFKK